VKMAKNYEEFRDYGKQMVDYICDYIKTMGDRNVAPTITPKFLVPLLAKNIPEKSESYEAIMEDIEKKIMPGVVHWNHPNFFAYFGAGNAYPSILADMLGAAIGSIGFSWVS
jgi:tyrosine decarboxylase